MSKAVRFFFYSSPFDAHTHTHKSLECHRGWSHNGFYRLILFHLNLHEIFFLCIIFPFLCFPGLSLRLPSQKLDFSVGNGPHELYPSSPCKYKSLEPIKKQCVVHFFCCCFLLFVRPTQKRSARSDSAHTHTHRVHFVPGWLTTYRPLLCKSNQNCSLLSNTSVNERKVFYLILS